MPGDEVGSASVKLTADLGPLETQLQAAQNKVEAWVKSTSGQLTIGGSKGELRLKVKADVELDKVAIANAIQAAINTKTYKLTIDAENLTRQIQSAFDKVTVNVNVGSVQGTPSPGQPQAGSAEQAIRTMPAALVKAFSGASKETRDVIGEMHDTLKELGADLTAPGGRGHELEQYVELIGRYGDNLKDLVADFPQFKTDPVLAGLAKTLVTKGARYQGEVRSTMGSDLATAYRGPAGAVVGGAIGKQVAAHLKPVLTNALKEANQPSAKAADPVATLLKQIRSESKAAAVGAITNVEPVDLGTALFTGSRARPRRGGRRTGGADVLRTAGTELFGTAAAPRNEAERIRAEEDAALAQQGRRQLGRAGGRGTQLQGGSAVVNIPGFGRQDLGELLEELRGGAFNDLIEVVGKKSKQQGQIGRLAPSPGTTGPELLEQVGMIDELRRRGGKGFTLPNVSQWGSTQLGEGGLGGQVRTLSARDAFGKALNLRMTGGALDQEQVNALLETPEIKGLLDDAMAARGSRTSGRGGRTRDIGKPYYASQRPGSKEEQAPYRILELTDQISETYDRIEKMYGDLENRQGSGRPTTRLETSIRAQERRHAQLMEQRQNWQNMIAPQGPSMSPEMAAEQRRMGPEYSQKRVERGVGLTPLERYNKQLKDPRNQGRVAKAAIAAGQLPNPEDIIARAQAEMLETVGSPGPTGPLTAPQAIKRLFGQKAGQNRSASGYRAEYGQMLGEKPDPDLRRDLEFILSSIEGTFQTDFAERDEMAQRSLKADAGRHPGESWRVKESPGATDVAGMLATDRSRKARQRLEKHNVRRRGIYNDPTGRMAGPGWSAERQSVTNQIQELEGQREKAIEAARQEYLLKSTRGTTTGPNPLYDVPDRGDAAKDPEELTEALKGIGASFDERLAPLRRQQRALGLRPRGRLTGKLRTGTETQELYRKAGGPTLVPPPAPPWAEEGSGGAGGGRGGRGGGAGGSGRFGAPSGGTVPVFVVNWPSGLVSGGGGGRPGRPGRVAPAVAAAAAVEAATDEEAAGGNAPGNQGGRIGLLREPRTAAFTGDRYKIRMVPREVRSPQQVALEREQAAADKAAAAAAKAAAAPAAGVKAGRPQFSIQERAAQLAQIERDRTARIVSPIDPGVVESQTRATLAQQRLQSRALGTSFVSIAESLFGGKQQSITQITQLRNAANRQRMLQDQSESIQQRLFSAEDVRGGSVREIAAFRQQNPRQAIPGDLRERHRGDVAAVLGLRDSARNNAKALNDASDEVETLGKAAGGASSVLRNLAAGFIGGIAGGFVTGIVGNIASSVLPAVLTAVGPQIERATGFTATTARVTGALADAFRQGAGMPGVIAGAVAPTGISAQGFAAIGPAISQRAEVEAGNKAIQEQMDQLRSFIQLQGQGQVGGFDRGLFQTTGGFLNTPIGGTPSTIEQLANDLGNLKNLPTSVEELAAQRGLPGVTDPGLIASMSHLPLPDLGKNLETVNKALATFNGQLEKGGSAVRVVTGANQQQYEQIRNINAPGSREFADALEASHTQLTNFTPTVQNLGDLLKSYNQAGPALTPELLIEQMQPEIRARTHVEDRQRQFQLGQINTQFGMQQAQAPIGDIIAPLRAAGITNFGQLPQQLAQINREAAAGIAQAKEFVATTFSGDASVGANFAASLDNVARLGKEISGIQIGAETEQAAYQAAQYSFQLYQANRALKDAQGLISGIGSSLGAIERQQWNLQRQSQSLSLGMSQRQINFQQAIAGFTAPGLTGEERAARIKEAKIEADYAQKQLDIQKKLFGLGGRQFKITADRSLIDATRSIALLSQGRKVALDTAEASKKIQALTLLQAKENAKVQTYYQAAVARTNDVIELEGKLIATVAKGLDKVTKLAMKAFQTQFQGIIDAINTGLSGTGGDRGDRPLHTGPGHASGALGLTRGITALGVAGEAGTEAVAIIRNPRPYTGGGGGGGMTVIFNITGNTVRNDGDLRRLTDAVEARLSRKIALLGGRSIG